MAIEDLSATVLNAIRPAAPELILIASLVFIAIIGLHVIEKLGANFRKKWKDPLKAKFVQGSLSTIFVGIIIIIMPVVFDTILPNIGDYIDSTIDIRKLCIFFLIKIIS